VRRIRTWSTCTRLRRALEARQVLIPQSSARRHAPGRGSVGLGIATLPYLAYEKTAKPKFYVEFAGAGHFAWTNLNRRYQRSIEAYGVAFFDAYLKGETKRLSQLLGSGRPNDVSDLRAAR
jgi:hypothetical protein